jgi:DUF1365 family protein
MPWFVDSPHFVLRLEVLVYLPKTTTYVSPLHGGRLFGFTNCLQPTEKLQKLTIGVFGNDEAEVTASVAEFRRHLSRGAFATLFSFFTIIIHIALCAIIACSYIFPWFCK